MIQNGGKMRIRTRRKTHYHNIVWDKKGSSLCMCCINCGFIVERVRPYQDGDEKIIEDSKRSYAYIQHKYGNIAIPSVNQQMIETSRKKLWERVKIWVSLGWASPHLQQIATDQMENLGKRIQENHVRQVEL